MFIEHKEKTIDLTDISTPNELLLDKILDHLNLLNDDELKLTKDESERFTQQIINKYDSNCSFKINNETVPQTQWRCFLKGISVTHVILTFVPSTLNDLKILLSMKSDLNLNTTNVTLISEERTPSRESNYSDVPINVANNVYLPIYVFDCPLALIVNAFIQDNATINKYDITEDHRFKPMEDDFEEEECIKIKDNSRNDTKSENYDSSDNSTIKRHCKALILAHSKCFTITLFVSLHLGLYIDNYDVQSVMDLCEESITEIDITDYMKTVCAHVKSTDNDKIDVKYLSQPLPCNDLRPLHSLIKEKFFDIVGSSFYPIPTNSDFYYYRNHSNVENDVNDSDDEISLPQLPDPFKSDNFFNYARKGRSFLRFESTSDIQTEASPLFLHLICTVKFNLDGSDNNKSDYGHINKSIRVLPTCLGKYLIFL